MGKRLQGLNATYLNLVFRPYNGAMSRKILVAAVGVGAGIVAFATVMDFERGSDTPRSYIPRIDRGMIVGTMAHLKGVKLRAVARLPDYVANTEDIKNWDHKPGHVIVLYNQLDILMGNRP
jgi:hypothetical protein